MSMTTFLGLSFGVFPCLLFGFIMLLSLLICEYIEEYVAKHLCAWKSRRRRGLSNFYRELPNRRSSQSNSAHQTSQYRRPAWGHAPVNLSDARVAEPLRDRRDDELYPDDRNARVTPTAPTIPHEFPLNRRTYPENYALMNDPPPRYEECVLPRTRIVHSDCTHEAGGFTDDSKS